MDTYAYPRNRVHTGSSESYRKQSDLIVQCARKCYETKGVGKTTLVDIANEAGITRELIYYYFSGKREITTHVVDSFVRDAVESARLWCDEWGKKGDEGPLPKDAFVDAVATMRRFAFQTDGTRRPFYNVLIELGLQQKTSTRMCDEIVSTLGNTPAADRLRATFPKYSKHTGSAPFQFVFFGSIGVMDGLDPRYDSMVVDIITAGASFGV